MDLGQLMRRPGFWRLVAQWSLFGWVLWIGARFGRFVRHFETEGAAPFVPRPPGVEGFLPIGALASLKHWLATGVFNATHPAALVLFLTIVGVSLLAKKSFCSWLCPVGTLSEAAWKGGRLLFGSNFTIWRWLDLPLRGLKYLLLLFFVKIILLDMPPAALEGFLTSPYWAVSDVKMLHFFTRPSGTAVAVIAVLGGLSLLYKNFWCRYLCPYGALLGLASLASPFKILRDQDTCNGCGRCRRACPSRLPVDRKRRVASVECTGCLTCTEACPQRALAMAPPLLKKPVPGWVFPATVVGLFAAGVGAGMLSGHWQTALTYEDYRQLIPMAGMFSH
jgi:polyferredoxin